MGLKIIRLVYCKNIISKMIKFSQSNFTIIHLMYLFCLILISTGNTGPTAEWLRKRESTWNIITPKITNAMFEEINIG